MSAGTQLRRLSGTVRSNSDSQLVVLLRDSVTGKEVQRDYMLRPTDFGGAERFDFRGVDAGVYILEVVQYWDRPVGGNPVNPKKYTVDLSTSDRHLSIAYADFSPHDAAWIAAVTIAVLLVTLLIVTLARRRRRRIG